MVQKGNVSIADHANLLTSNLTEATIESVEGVRDLARTSNYKTSYIDPCSGKKSLAYVFCA